MTFLNFKRIKTFNFIFIAIVLFSILSPTSAIAYTTGVPSIINFQGRLMDPSGNLLGGSGTSYCFRFSIYDSADNTGTNVKLWPSGTPTNNTLTVRQGVFDAQVGTADSLSGYNFQQDNTIYMNVDVAAQVGGTCSGVNYDTLYPRPQIVAAAFAITAGTVTGYVPASGKTLTVNNSMTFNGTDATTMTFPSASKTLAANDGSNWTFASQAIGDIPVASSTTAYGNLADVATGSVLTSGGVGVTPTWSSTPTFAGTNITGTAPSLTAGAISSQGSLATLNAAPAGTLTGTVLAPSVVSSSLTSIGTITTGVWHGTALTSTYLPSATVYNNQANTYSTGLQDFSSASMKLPASVTVGANSITLPASAGTVALTSQITGTNSGTNTGDQTLTIAGTTSPTIALSGSNTATFASGTGISLGQSAGTITITNSAPAGTWGALNYPTWVSGTPFVKMTAAGTFALDTNTYLTGNQTITLSGPVTGSGTTAITTAIANGAISNAMLANGAVANLSGTNTGDQTLTIAGTTSPTIALSGSNTATFASGTGITLGQSGGTITITNSAPDKTVAFTGGTNVTIGGTYPNFTISDSSINSSVATLSSLSSIGTITTGVWHGTALTSTYLPSTLVYNNQANTYSTGLQDFSSATMKLPASVTVGANSITLPASAGTVALTSQITGTNSGTNTGDNAINSNYTTLANTLSGNNTWTGTQTFNTSAPIIGTATASTIAGFSATNQLISLPVATYPSLTELSYVKGVTSAIQTQLNAKGTFTLPALTSGSVLFSDGSTISQDNANFFWDSTNHRLGLGMTAPTAQLSQKSTAALETASLGAELTTSGDTVAGTGWSAISWGPPWTATVVTAGAGNGALTDATFNPTVNSTGYYQITTVVSGTVAGSLSMSFGGVNNQTAYTAAGTYYFSPKAATTDVLTYTPDSSFTGTITFSIMKITTYGAISDLTDNTGVIVNQIHSSTASLHNMFYGVNSGRYNVQGYDNSAFGYNSFIANTTGYYNVALGYTALSTNTTGYSNTAVGSQSLSSNTTGFQNTGVGASALNSLTTGNNNTALSSALGSLTTGSNNMAIGYASLNYITTTSNNVAIGYNAGRYYGSSTSNHNTGGGTSTFIGGSTYPQGASDTNETVIGYGAVGLGNNSVSLGNASVATIGVMRNITSNTAGTSLTIQSSGATSGATDKNGGGLTLSSGIATGTGSSILHFFTATAQGSTNTTDNTPTEKMTILGSGNVGIGTTTPANLFQVTGTPAAGVSVAQIDNTLGGTTQNNGLLIVAGNTGGTAASQFATFQISGGAVIGSISQTNTTTVAYNTSSDQRIKENIVPTTYGISDLMKINVEDFNFITDPTKQKNTGFIAQNLYSVFPEAVTTNGDNGTNPLALGTTPWMVDYSKVTPLIVKSIQDMNLNLEGIAGTTTPIPGTDADTFVTAFFKNIEAKIGTWLADAGNGITSIFAQQVNTKSLCVSDDSGAKTCITKSQLDALLDGAVSNNPNNLNNQQAPIDSALDGTGSTTTTDGTGGTTTPATPPVLELGGPSIDTSGATTPNQSSPSSDGTGQATPTDTTAPVTPPATDSSTATPTPPSATPAGADTSSGNSSTPATTTQ